MGHRQANDLASYNLPAYILMTNIAESCSTTVCFIKVCVVVLREQMAKLDKQFNL